MTTDTSPDVPASEVDASDPVSVFGPVNSSCSRTRALGDDRLIDVSDLGKEYGVIKPVAITAGAWLDCVAWADEDSRRQISQTEDERLRDLCLMVAFSLKVTREEEEILLFPLYRVPRDGHSTRARESQLKMVVGRDDESRKVVTIMLPDEA